MAKQITIYTTNTCVYCHAVKQFLSSREMTYDVVNLDEQPEKRQELLSLSGQLAVPVTVVTKDDGSRDLTVGFNPGKLAAAISS